MSKKDNSDTKNSQAFWMRHIRTGKQMIMLRGITFIKWMMKIQIQIWRKNRKITIR